MWQRAWLAHFVVLKGSNLFLLKRVESKYPTAVLSLKKSQVRNWPIQSMQSSSSADASPVLLPFAIPSGHHVKLSSR